MRYLCALLLAFACVSLSQTASAQISIVPYAGYGSNTGVNLEGISGWDDGVFFLDRQFFDGAGGVFAGIGVEFDLPFNGTHLEFKLRPSLEYHFYKSRTDGEENQWSRWERTFSQSRIQANIDLIGYFNVDASFSPYIGAGFMWGRINFKGIGEWEDLSGWCNQNCTESVSVSEDYSGFGLNLLAGAQLGSLEIGIPFVEIRYRHQFWGIEQAGSRSGELFFNGLSIAAGVSIPLGN